MISFRQAASLLALVCAVLFAILLFAPAAYVSVYGFAPDESAAFISRRASPLMLGFALLLWSARDLRKSPARDAIRLTVIVIFAGIAATGIGEFLIGSASATILMAATAELAIACIFLWGLRDTD